MISLHSPPLLFLPPFIPLPCSACIMRLSLLFVFFSLIVFIHCAVVEYDLDVSAKWLAPDGHWRKTYAINGQTPGPLIECTQCDTLRVRVHNSLSISISIHWHGQIQRRGWMDGVPGVTQWPILSRDTYEYEFVCEEYGMYWVSEKEKKAARRQVDTAWCHAYTPFLLPLRPHTVPHSLLGCLR